MSKKRFCSVFLPWCVFALLLGHEAWHIGARCIMREGTRILAAPVTGLEHENLKILDPFGALEVAAETDNSSHYVMVTVFNRHFMYVHKWTREYGGSVQASLVRDIRSAPVALISCGIPKLGKKRGYINVRPQTGADRGAELLDYDLDGVFEVRLGGTKTKAVAPAESAIEPERQAE